jgi:peptidoglycan/xylan/chitin deacetylase (PgdA/CDA1 family)
MRLATILLVIGAALVLTAPSGATLPASMVGTEWTHLPTERKVVALTIDACGNASGIGSILASLRAHAATATFFLCGRWARMYPRRARTIAAGYPVGNHTDTHPFATTLSDEALRREVRAAAATIRTIARRDPRPLFRFPYGDRDARTIRVVNLLGYGAVGWTVDTLGWQGRVGGRTPGWIRHRVLAALRPGAIVLMHAGAAHDGSRLDADALPGVIRGIRGRGYELVTVREFARASPRQPGRQARKASDDSYDSARTTTTGQRA